MGAVRTVVIQSVRGEVREFVSSVGFETSVEELLDRIQERFGKHWTADCLKQEFYQLTQGKTKKVQQFTGRLEAKFKQLREKIPGMYKKGILKERLFHGIHKDLRDSIWFCYKKAGKIYDELLNEMLDVEWEKSTEMKTTSLNVRSAVTTAEDGGIKDLKQKIDQLATVVKSSTFGGAKSKKGNTGITNVANGQYTGKDKSKRPASPYKGQGPTTLVAGPFKNGQKPYHCYNCGGWGHSYRQCPSQGGHQLEEPKQS